MPIGTIIGMLFGALIVSMIVINAEADHYRNKVIRNQATIEQSRHRSLYSTVMLASFFGLIGTFIEILVR